ncbi:uncharacterized protein METZ01_LOCUS174477 [marine metagenome]|uniref:Uncharacterized protein n=1 Tax=marine metagenome TaxID=408172 RepID=A0A382C8L7_9ZZZZ
MSGSLDTDGRPHFGVWIRALPGPILREGTSAMILAIVNAGGPRTARPDPTFSTAVE